MFGFFPTFAQEIPVDIKADNLKYYEDSGLVEASGAVEVKLKDATIYSDRLRMDSRSNIVTAEGNVRLIAGNNSATSATLVYDADKQTSDFSDFKTVRGKMHFFARELSDNKKKMSGRSGGFTTCEDQIPHYFMLANKVNYYPDDKIEAANATFYVGEAPVFWLPYFYYDLSSQRRKNWNWGHNDLEGNFIKSAWAYPLGILLLDYMEKKGVGVGTDSIYTSGTLGSGSLYLYHVKENDTGVSSWVEKIHHEKQLRPATKLKLDHSYIDTYLVPSGRIGQTTFGLELSYAEKDSSNLKFNVLDDRVGLAQKYGLQFNQTSGKSSTGYSMNYDLAKNDPKWMRNSQRFYHSRPLWSDRINFSTTTNYYRSVAKEGDPGEEKIEPRIDLSGSEKDFSWRLTENWLVDLRQYLSPGVPRYEFLEKLPELEIYPRSLDLNLFTLQSTLGYGRYREVKYVTELAAKRDFTAERYRATLNAGKSIPLSTSTVLALGAGVDQFYYSPGDQLYALRENAGMTTNLRSCFRNDINFRQGYTEGNTPFFFDQLGTRYHDIREKMTFYYQDKFDWSTDGGYNWQTQKYFDVMTHLMLSPDRRMRWTVDTGWDIENRRYKDLVTGIRFAPASYFAAQFSAARDLNVGELRSASALYDIYFMEGASNQTYLRFSQVFDPSTKEFKVRDIMAVKDLHCWEIKYTYSDYRKEFSLVFSLKALPGEPVGFSTGRGFYYDGFERELGKIKPEGEVRRY